MKTYNERFVEHLRGGVYGLNRTPLCAEAADRILELEKALHYIHDNPHAHPENVKWVAKNALGIK